MNKKFLGIKLSTIFTVFICLILAVIVWMLVNYNLSSGEAVSLSDYVTLLRG